MLPSRRPRTAGLSFGYLAILPYWLNESIAIIRRHLPTLQCAKPEHHNPRIASSTSIKTTRATSASVSCHRAPIAGDPASSASPLAYGWGSCQRPRLSPSRSAAVAPAVREAHRPSNRCSAGTRRGGRRVRSPAASVGNPPNRRRGADGGWASVRDDPPIRSPHRGGREPRMRASLPTLRPGPLLQVGASAPGPGALVGEAPALTLGT